MPQNEGSPFQRKRRKAKKTKKRGKKEKKEKRRKKRKKEQSTKMRTITLGWFSFLLFIPLLSARISWEEEGISPTL